MSREDIITNLLSTYAKYGVTRFILEQEIESGLKQGFSYQTIYTGLRMTLGNVFHEREYFTPAEMAEALGTTEEEIINQVEVMGKELEAQGEDPSEYFTRVEPVEKQTFIIPPGALK
ncbi:hypothetical protein H0486_18115 [Lachnospiraceae bacterium MD1]|uniref:Uncharacterized protein n=1 Tax=Variimorphobacter saccharofermentans TaxID=2755051 RepID=A0A839K4G7_9FIRM|nr:hypothetical protein [Variimorphobacter saccharofermentans]MBB2184774.1 hypothetical protein [Variimorphobacter saccharofermentans]